MSIQVLYCHNCHKKYNVRQTDIELVKEQHKTFDGKEYKNGCFFKALRKIKKEINQKAREVL